MAHTAPGVFLGAAWTFAAYNFIGMAAGVLADLPPCNGETCSTARIRHQAVLGNGTALSPPLFLSVVWELFVLAASRRRWLGAVGAFIVLVSAGFHVSAGLLGELTSTTSPLTGLRWGLVIALGSIGNGHRCRRLRGRHLMDHHGRQSKAAEQIRPGIARPTALFRCQALSCNFSMMALM